MVKLGVIATVLALSLGACSEDAKTQANGPWDPDKEQPLVEPVQIAEAGDTVHVALDAAAAAVNESGSDLRGSPFEGNGKGAHLVGPTIRVRPGQKIAVTFKNGLDAETNIHYHGLHVSPGGESDNVFRVFKNGETYTSTVAVGEHHPVGTYWYHVHLHGISEGQVMGGLSGLLIVEGLETHLTPPQPNIKQQQLAIREVSLVKDTNQIATSPSDINIGSPTAFLVNGQLYPKIAISQGETQLWRVANIGPNGMYTALKLVNKETGTPAEYAIVAEDGNPLFEGKQWRTTTADLPAGKRYDILVTGPAAGTYELRATFLDTDKPLALVNVTSGQLRGAGPSNAALTTDADGVRRNLSGLPNVKTREFRFEFGGDGPDKDHLCQGDGACINEVGYARNRLDVAVHIGDVEEWTLLNYSAAPHPFHIHVNEFQVIQIGDQKQEPTGMEDVVTIPARNGTTPGKVVIRNEFRDFNGWFVYHCHILRHEDEGMMQNIQVLGPGDTEGPPPPDSMHDM
ncbi:MAG TPA: multicopper oxidase family protein [Acidimicrobiales bacterium]|nr:multicopper oxidase family protein [Acidimicrobiales bacterium]